MPRCKGPDSDKIYAQYITYYNDCVAKINAIDALDPKIRDQTNVQDDRSFIWGVLANKTLYVIMQKDYNTTLDQYVADCASLEEQIQECYNNAMGGRDNPYANQIQKDWLKAQNESGAIATDLTNANTILDSSDTFQATLNALQSQVDLLLPGPAKDQAQADLDNAKQNFQNFTALLPNAFLSYSNLKQAYDNLMVKGGAFNQLQNLAGLTDPDQANAATADSLLTQFDAVTTQDSNFQTGIFAQVNAVVKSLQIAITKVQNDLNPTPTPNPGKVENACWYIDWTSWDFPVPEGVNVVNIFVGKLDFVDGQPTATGFGNMDIAHMKAFVNQCQAKGIACKISIGGHGGSNDNCWDALTDLNVPLFAQGLAKFCHDNNLAGIDFDYEETSSDPTQCARVGKLIKAFKQQDQKLQTSLCTNASFQAWSARVQSIVDPTVDGGQTSLDRLYVMSYYDPMSSEAAWLAQWVDFVKKTYNMDSLQVTVGIDNFDADAYNIADMASLAGAKQMGTGYWATNPADMTKSNDSTNKIKQAYDAGSNVQFVKNLQRYPVKSATRIQKIVAFIFQRLHAIFVVFPKWIFNGLTHCDVKSSDKDLTVPLLITVSNPTAPYDDGLNPS